MLIFENVMGQTTQTIIPDKRGISFTLAPGQVGVLYGSGERAQDFLLMAAGRGILDAGAIYFEYGHVKKLFDYSNAHLKNYDISWRKVVGYCPREEGLLSNLNLLENVELPFEYHGEGNAPHPHDALDFFEVPSRFWEMRPNQVPQEIRKRTLLARTIVGGTNLLLWEDPCSNLPWEKWGKLIGKILELKKQGKSILLTTAEAPFACAVADWVLYLKDNQLFENGKDFFSETIQKVAAMLVQDEVHVHDG